GRPILDRIRIAMSVSLSPPPMRITAPATLNVTPLAGAPGAGAEVEFGADAGALDLERLSDAQFAALERAVLTHQVVVVREQQRLSPRAQFELTRRFDPKVQTYGHGHRLDIMKQS